MAANPFQQGSDASKFFDALTEPAQQELLKNNYALSTANYIISNVIGLDAALNDPKSIIFSAPSPQKSKGSYEAWVEAHPRMSLIDSLKGTLKVAAPFILMANPAAGAALGSALGAGTGAAATALGNAVISGTLAEVQGGDFLTGALSSVATTGLDQIVNPAISSSLGGGATGNIAANALTKGLLAEVQGGDFSQGAIQGGILAAANALDTGTSGVSPTETDRASNVGATNISADTVDATDLAQLDLALGGSGGTAGATELANALATGAPTITNTALTGGSGIFTGAEGGITADSIASQLAAGNIGSDFVFDDPFNPQSNVAQSTGPNIDPALLAQRNISSAQNATGVTDDAGLLGGAGPDSYVISYDGGQASNEGGGVSGAEAEAANNLAQNLVANGMSTSEASQILNSVGFDQNVVVDAVNNVTLDQVISSIANNTETGGVDYSLSTGTNNLTDMGGAQGLQNGSSENLESMGGGQGVTLNLGGQSTTLADAIETLAGVGPRNLESMGGGQGLTLQTDTGLVTEGGVLNIGGLTGNTDVIGETGVNTATNIGYGLGDELAAIDTGVDDITLPSSRPLTFSDALNLANLVNIITSSDAEVDTSNNGLVSVPSSWTPPPPPKVAEFTPLTPIDFGNKEMLRGTQWEKLLDPNYGKAPVPAQFNTPSDMSYAQLMSILGSGRDVMPSRSLTINDVISGIQNQYGQTPASTVG